MNRKLLPTLEPLEDRLAPATYGVPWPNAERLTLSFAPDGTRIAGHTSDLFRVLDAHAPTAVWQRDILRAFQTWVVQGNLNVGLLADGGQPFGVAGRPFADGRFGDVRLGAQRMSRESLASAIPFSPVFSGTLTGDVFLNSATDFSGQRLYATLLHEAGHVFGLDHSDDPASPRYAHLNHWTRLTDGDVAALQALYGPRMPDSHEGPQGNADMRTATPIRQPRRQQRPYDGSTPLVLFGDVTSWNDVDMYLFRPVAGYRGPVTFRLQTEGVSLLAPRLTVLNAAGQELGQAAAVGATGGTVSVQLAQVDPAADYYLRVDAAVCDEFAIGAYGLAVSHDAVSRAQPSGLDRFLRGPYQELTPEEIDGLFLDSAHTFVTADHRNNDFARAELLRRQPGSGPFIDVIGSLSDTTNADYYRVQTNPSQTEQRPVLTVLAWGFTDNAIVPRISVFAQNRTPVPAEVLLNGNGTFALEINVGHSGGFYYLRLSNPTNGGDRVGNYALHILFTEQTADLDTFAGGGLDDQAPDQTHDLYVAHSRLFQFALSANGANATVRMRIFDSSRAEVFRLDTAAGDTTSGSSVFLTPGAYTVTFTALAPASVPPLSYRLRGKGLGDPIGPALEDPTLLPMYESPGNPLIFIYPGDIRTHATYHWVALC